MHSWASLKSGKIHSLLILVNLGNLITKIKCVSHAIYKINYSSIEYLNIKGKTTQS